MTELVKYGHASVVLGQGGRRLVLDPGTMTGEEALAAASAALVTHEHADHFDPRKLKAALDADPGFEVWTNASVARQLDGGPRVHVVGAGDEFTAAGLTVRVHGEWHAEVHQDIPRVGNIGFLVASPGGPVFHPGDAFTVPDEPVGTLLLPVHGPWSRVGQLVDWVREVKPGRCVAVHDAGLSDTGLGTVDRLFGERGPGIGAAYTRLTPGAALTLD
ncbi:MAG TPA: MBL fold metallo-hydrolase [Pseudonocardiaceae bacterium]|nr:MBL fold metallo-hydrolase [Pseudonocardiaceae bacterium]